MSDKNKQEDQKPDAIQAVGKCTITAAITEEGKPEKLPRVDIMAYNGGIMSVGWWGPVVIDLSGLKAKDKNPILFGHSTFSTDSIMGQTDGVTNDGKTLSVSGDIMGESRTVKETLALAKKGFEFQASVGVRPKVHSYVEQGQEIEVNGQKLSGPFTMIGQSELKEISIVPLGADGATSAKIAAEQQRVNAKTKENTMAQKPDGEGTNPTAEDIRAAAVAEETRISAVRETAKDHPEICASAIKDGLTPEQVKVKVLEAKLAAEIKRNERPLVGAFGINTGKGLEVNASMIEAAACLQGRVKNPEKLFASDTLNKAESLKLRSLTDLVRATLALSGKTLDVTRHDTREYLQAAFSTRDISNVLSAVANKFITEGFGAVEESWKEIANVRSVVDFKTNTGVRLVMANLLKTLSPSGEIQHGALSDETRTIKADTKALMLGVTRQDIINDDLSVLTDIPRRLGYAAGRTFNTDFWTAFEAAVAANFSASKPKFNQTTGALSLTTLATAEALFLALKDADGNPLGVKASKLLCGTTAYTKSRELYISTGLIGGSAKDAAANIYANMFKPVFSSYLSAAPWYLTADPMAVPVMEAAFLNGRQEPFVETADADFNTLGVQMRCYYDYGVAFAEWRGAVRSTGVL